MGLERFQDADIGLSKFADPIISYQMLVSDLVVRPYSSGAMFNVRLATAAALGAVTASGSGKNKTLTQDSFAVETIDSVAPIVGDLILVQDQAQEIDNGIYRITVVGDAVSAVQTLVRAVEYDSTAEVILGTLFHVLEGTVNGDTIVHISAAPAVLDTNDWDFTAGIYASRCLRWPRLKVRPLAFLSGLPLKLSLSLSLTRTIQSHGEGIIFSLILVIVWSSILTVSRGWSLGLVELQPLE